MLAALRFGNVVLMIQPPRGFGENPIAIYHDPDMPPSHHYLAAYRWLEPGRSFGADAVVHLGKHGTLEWLPGKGLGLAAGCAPDAVLGDLPLVYPFIVNDPGEGTQAKRRGARRRSSTTWCRRWPAPTPTATWPSWSSCSTSTRTVAALDPAKAAGGARADLDAGAGRRAAPRPARRRAAGRRRRSTTFVLHIDGYLCEIKDVQIRDGLHILGGGPVGEPRVNLVLAVLRAPQVWGGAANALPGLRGRRSPSTSAWSRRSCSPSRARR